MYAQARTSNATASITSFSISPPRPEQYVPILFGRRELPQRAEQRPLRANATSAVAGPLLAGNAEFGMPPLHFVTGRDAPHTRLPAGDAPLDDPFRVYCRRDPAAPLSPTYPRSRPIPELPAR